MSQRCLRQRPRISYYELEEPNLDEYVYCDKCADLVYEYCSFHGPLLVIPDDKVSPKPNVPSYVPSAALTIPNVFLHLAPSSIPEAGLGMFATLTLPSGVRFGPYTGEETDSVDSYYCWQIYDSNRKPTHCIDAANANKSNWMRYVNCARHWSEQNLVAFQYQGQLYYRTIKIIPRFTELLVFYGSEFANELDIDLGKYNSSKYAIPYMAPNAKKWKLYEETPNIYQEQENDFEDIEDINKHSNDSHNTDIDKQWNNNENAMLAQTSNTASREDNMKEIGAAELVKGNCPKINKSILDFESSRAFVNTDLYHCDFCGTKFIIKGDLEKHMRFHDLNRSHACEVCKHRFVKFHDLKRHRLSVHQIKRTDMKVYACEICDKNFDEISKLVRHLRTHGEKSFACTTCNKKFTDKRNLNRHTRTHTGVKPFACTICNMKFTDKRNLNRHTRTHTGVKPFACTTCNKKFTDKRNLNRHTRTHTGVKPFACTTCNMKFTDKYNLKRHIRTHTGEKPFPCTTCNMQFANHNGLKRHMKGHMLVINVT